MPARQRPFNSGRAGPRRPPAADKGGRRLARTVRWRRCGARVPTPGAPTQGSSPVARVGKSARGLSRALYNAQAMRPLLHPALVNGRSGDPALYVETLFERRALMFDLGDIASLPARKILRLEHVFVSHAHIDHFIGFDHLLRVLVGRDKRLNLYGPAGFIDRVAHKLLGYCWNLIDRFADDLVFVVTEVGPDLRRRTARLRLKNGFAVEAAGAAPAAAGILVSEPTFRVAAAALDHGTPCLGFAVEEEVHVNVLKSRLDEQGLPVGSWLRELKRAVVENKDDDQAISVAPPGSGAAGRAVRLGELRSAVTVTPGQKIAYVTDVSDSAANRRKIVALARNADVLFIEATFARADAALAAQRAHLTTAAAGAIAREAAVRKVEPFHFSPRYSGQEARLCDEVRAAFAGR